MFAAPRGCALARSAKMLNVAAEMLPARHRSAHAVGHDTRDHETRLLPASRRGSRVAGRVVGRVDIDTSVEPDDDGGGCSSGAVYEVSDGRRWPVRSHYQK